MSELRATYTLRLLDALPLSLMRIAFFGGTFDPPHRGHLAIARAALRRFAMDEVWMAPAGAQPLKRNEEAASYDDRLEMVALAVEACRGITASAVDAPRSDGKPNYTIDVLTAIRGGLEAQDELFFLLGADAFLSLRQWHRAAELPFLCKLIVAGRPGFSLDDLAEALPSGLRMENASGVTLAGGVVARLLRNDADEESTLYLMPDLREDVSATDIRAAIAGEESASGVLSPAVVRYIEEKKLYR